MGKRLVGKVLSLLAISMLALPFTACTAPGSGGGSGEAAKVETGGAYRCSCGITRKVGPGARVPECCGKPMKAAK